MRRAIAGFLLLLLAVATAAGAVRWPEINRQPAAWYGSAEARNLADTLRQYQSPEGGWPKNHDMTVPPSAEFLADTKYDHRAPTIDNDATTTQLELLARVVTAGGAAPLRAAFDRGFEYLLRAQYDSGGWPQYFPLIKGYYTHITYNDDAMVNVLTLLRAASRGDAPYAFTTPEQRARAAAAVAKGTACILRTQVRQDGRLTAWCAQHDEVTFVPAWARNFEPPSLSGEESVGLVRFLLGIEQPGPDVVAAIEGAVRWFREVEVHGLRIDNTPGADGGRDRHVVADPGARGLWARFYELGTNRPIFTGRDRVIRYSLNEIERERRIGYVYLGAWPATLLDKDYPRWRASHPVP